jgi:hypothetical protein
MKAINRIDLPIDYVEMMKTEQHHDHEIIKDELGTIRWKEDPFTGRLTDACNLNDIIRGFYAEGNGKNSEVYRELYRNMGYSLSGYWDIFYWDMNNENADQYQPPQR